MAGGDLVWLGLTFCVKFDIIGVCRGVEQPGSSFGS